MTERNCRELDAPAQKLSWNTHYLLTRIALQTCPDTRLNQEIRVVRLEDFLSRCGAALRELIRWHWGLLEKKSGLSGNANAGLAGLAALATGRDFLTALRLNPDVSIPYVRCMSPEEAPSHAPHDPSRSGPPRGVYQETPEGALLKVHELLSVFADEPDWGMDQDLFLVESYGYGPVPFGSPTGHSSQACFHMAFFHENPLLVAVFPGLKKSFLEERVRLFLALAQVAFDSGVDYWGWRFTAWAMHYLQDLSQPYHAKALPFPLWRVLLHLLSYPHPRSFAEKHRNVLMNRHYLFEALVHLMLNRAVKQRGDHPFVAALAEHGEYHRGPLRVVMEHVSRNAATLAPRINELLKRLLNDARIDRSDYLASDDPLYPLEERLAAASVDRPAVVREFLGLVSRCLSMAGIATTSVVRGMLS